GLAPIDALHPAQPANCGPAQRRRPQCPHPARGSQPARGFAETTAGRRVKPRRGALLIAGVMSGTSLDGLDVALVECGPGRAWKLRGFRHAAYTRPQRARLLAAATGAANAPELARLHVWLGQRIGAAVRDACRASHLPLERLSAVASHGQTVYHEGGVATLQLGDPAQRARRWCLGWTTSSGGIPAATGRRSTWAASPTSRSSRPPPAPSK